MGIALALIHIMETKPIIYPQLFLLMMLPCPTKSHLYRIVTFLNKILIPVYSGAHAQWQINLNSTRCEVLCISNKQSPLTFIYHCMIAHSVETRSEVFGHAPESAIE